MISKPRFIELTALGGTPVIIQVNSISVIETAASGSCIHIRSLKRQFVVLEPPVQIAEAIDAFHGVISYQEEEEE